MILSLNRKSTVGDLKEYLNDILENLNEYDNDMKLNFESNTCFLGSCDKGFLGIEGYDGGYLNFNDPVIEYY